MNPSGETSVGAVGAGQGSSQGLLLAIVVALLASVALNVLLARKLQGFNRVGSAQIADRLLKIGTSVPPISAKRLDGQQELISYQNTNQSTVLYVFTPQCSWCARNVDNFKTLLGKESGEYRFIALSLSEEGLAQYVEANGLNVSVYSGLSKEALKAYKLGSTPQTIVVSPEGRVLQNWMGAYVGDQKSQVERFFHVSVPGLRALPEHR